MYAEFKCVRSNLLSDWVNLLASRVPNLEENGSNVIFCEFFFLWCIHHIINIGSVENESRSLN